MTSPFSEFKGVALINALRRCQLFPGLPQADLEQITAVAVLGDADNSVSLCDTCGKNVRISLVAGAQTHDGVLDPSPGPAGFRIGAIHPME